MKAVASTGRVPATSLRMLAAAIGAALTFLFLAFTIQPARASAASSPFAWRGVIQGQYGPQFSPADRRRLLRFAARNGFNAYVHAPKGDPYQRTLWRVPYPPDQQAVFDDEVRMATRLGIEWIPNVSPAAAAVSSPGDAAPPGTSPSPPICFSSDADLTQLLAKFEPFRQAGSDTFMVSFDDVRREFSCAADDAEYGGGDRAFGLANADLLNRFYAKLRERDPDAQLLTVASDYQGTADTAYLHAIRAALAPGIDVMWTGPSTESRPFSPDDADAYAGAIGRTPIVWENWTTNDVLSPPDSWPSRVFLGPYARRPNVVGHVKGFFFNPANQSDLNFLPLATAADWMWDPAHYRPRRAFLAETRKLAGRQSPALRAFAEANYSTTLRGSTEAPTLRRAIHRFLRSSGRHHGLAAARLEKQFHLAVSARRRLLRIRSLVPFVRQAWPFLRSVQLNARAGLLAADLLAARTSGERQRLRHRLQRALGRAASWPSQTYGTRSGLYGLTGNVVDDFVSRVRFRDRHRPPAPRHLKHQHSHHH
jgi:hyaluronoglucosaminidase